MLRLVVVVALSAGGAWAQTWSAGSWSTCSVACGGGVQARPVVCLDAGGAIVSDSLCTGTPPVSMQACNTQACPTYTWTATASVSALSFRKSA